MMSQSNFLHLKTLNSDLCRLGMVAEQVFALDANTCLIKTRQYTEFMVKDVAARAAAYRAEDKETAFALLNRLSRDGILPKQVADIFHAVRKPGNDAAHGVEGTSSQALTSLKFCMVLGVWYQRCYGLDANYEPPPFIVPKVPKVLSVELAAEIADYKEHSKVFEDRLNKLAKSDEERAAEIDQVRQDAERAVNSVSDLEKQNAELEKAVAKLQAKAEEKTEQQLQKLKMLGQNAAAKLELNENDTRKLIDRQLQDAGWEADTSTLRYSSGAQPEKGRNQAISEWPTEGGRVDYALFVGLECVGVIEAKRQSADVPSVLQQADEYAHKIKLEAKQLLIDAPWQHGLDEPYRVPFIFASNGRPFVRQFKTKSGIWFRDVRSHTNHASVLPSWFSPKDLADKLKQDTEHANNALAEEAFGQTSLRPYQEEAIDAVEKEIAAGKRSVLVAMATGTGKTRTCIALMYRLLKTKRFKRILFLVDRTALGDQTTDALNTTEFEGFYKFSQIYNVAGLDQKLPDDATQIHVATVQSLVARINNTEDPTERLTPGMYDCIVIDEAHRGYTLDADLREGEEDYRDVSAYESAYRNVLSYFDAIKIGLTATPALHTLQIFDCEKPSYSYGYRQAVVEGFLIDHLPPKRITTALAEAGITFNGGEEVEIVDRHTGEVTLHDLPDEVELEYDLAKFNRRVYSENFNRIVCQTVANEIAPDAPGKTLIFAATDTHADDIVRLLKEELREEYGDLYNDMVMKITGSVRDAKGLIKKFRNDPLPKYVVTVDLLTTGVDIPVLANLVFVRRVKSRILYDQMIGRATRLCPEIGKENFRIFDAVDLYAELQQMSDMRPVVVKPTMLLAELIADLDRAPNAEEENWVAGQVVVKMRALAKRMDKSHQEALNSAMGGEADTVINDLSCKSGAEVKDWLNKHPRALENLVRAPAKKDPLKNGVAISYHEDQLLHIREVFGDNATPESYIESFETYVRENMNTIPAMVAVTQKPRNLTRKELTELAAQLDEAHFSEAMLRAAYGRARNADIAAHIIGYVRQAALGDPLVPYAMRVENAIEKIIGSRDWKSNQIQWLRRIGRALKDKPVADPSLLNQGVFQDKGGFKRISKEFDGKLGDVLQEINEAIWTSSAA